MGATPKTQTRCRRCRRWIDILDDGTLQQHGSINLWARKPALAYKACRGSGTVQRCPAIKDKTANPRDCACGACEHKEA
jgi:hypothetical protein